MNQDKIVKRISDMWEEKVNEDSIIEKIQSEFQISLNDAEKIFELTQIGFLRASFINAGKKYPENNLTKNAIVETATKVALANLGKLHLYNTPVNQREWWKFWK